MAVTENSFKTLQVCQEGKSKSKIKIKIKKFQNLIGMLGSFPSGTLMKKVSFVSKPYRYARKDFIEVFSMYPRWSFKTLQVCQEVCCRGFSIFTLYEFQNLIGMLGSGYLKAFFSCRIQGFKTLQVCQEGISPEEDTTMQNGFKTLQVCQEVSTSELLWLSKNSFKTLQVCQEVYKFFIYCIIHGIVSKPYRYARKS